MSNKKLLAIIICAILSISLSSCSRSTKDSEEKINTFSDSVISTTTETATNGDFEKWYCSRENSCNDMDITIMITRESDQLHIDRDMKSPSGIGSSHLQYDAILNCDNSAYSEYVDGIYVFTDDCMYEIFIKNSRINKYYRAEN